MIDSKPSVISIIIPVYNVETYLRRCLDSILSQSHQQLDIVLVDDGSTDNSGKICDEYAEADARIQAIHKENGGLSSARNAGLDKASATMLRMLTATILSIRFFVNACCRTPKSTMPILYNAIF